MRTVFTLMTVAALAACASLAVAQSDKDHAAHHPGGASTPLPAAKKSDAPTPPPASAASGPKAMGMGGAGMKAMHDDMHKPGGMHEQKHGKDGGMMGAMAAASAASK